MVQLRFGKEGMVEESIFDQVRGIVADIFNLSIKEVKAESSPDTIGGWDSLQHLNLVLAIEQTFGIQLTPEEIEQMLSVELIVMLIQEKLLSKEK